MIYTWYAVNLPLLVLTSQPGLIKLRVRVANTTFVVKRAVSVAAAVVHARAGGGS